MPPGIRITKETIVDAALGIVRREGAEAVNARSLAGELSCSTQPIFSNFATMEELKEAVVRAAYALYQEYIGREITSGRFPEYKAMGMAYIRFAGEEKELFKLLFMRDRSSEKIPSENEEMKGIWNLVETNTGLSGDKAPLFHLEMWAYVHGIAVMIATDYLKLDWNLVSEMVTDAYQGMKIRYEGKV